MTKQRIATDGAPAALGAYSQAIDANGFVYCAGQLGLDPATGQLAHGIAGQTQRSIQNLAAVLDAAGLTLADVVKTTCFLTDIANFGAFNEVYSRFFVDTPPARSTFAVKDLPRGGLVEIEAIAARPAV
jgi:2-iminobutanoate/2-iminopropanoate deaminase